MFRCNRVRACVRACVCVCVCVMSYLSAALIQTEFQLKELWLNEDGFMLHVLSFSFQTGTSAVASGGLEDSQADLGRGDSGQSRHASMGGCLHPVLQSGRCQLHSLHVSSPDPCAHRSFSVCLSVACLSADMSVCQSASLSVCLPGRRQLYSLHASSASGLCAPLLMTTHSFVAVSVTVICLPVFMFTSLPVCLLVCLSQLHSLHASTPDPGASLFVCLSDYLPACLFVCLHICLSACLSL